VPPEVSTFFINGADRLGFDTRPHGNIYVSLRNGGMGARINTESLEVWPNENFTYWPPSSPPDTGPFTYTTAGEQIDTATGMVVGTFPRVNPAQSNVNLVVPNASSGLVFYLTPSMTVGAPAGTWTLRSFRTTDRTLVGSLDITVPGHPRNLIRFRERGIAFDDDVGYVFLVQSLRLGL